MFSPPKKKRMFSQYTKSCDQFISTSVSLSLQPFVSKGKNATARPEKKTTISKRIIAVVWWQLCTRATATSGQRMPPILPTELAMPMPVVLTEVG